MAIQKNSKKDEKNDSSADDLLNPNVSPNVVPPRTGVRRVNNLPFYVVGAFVTVFLVSMGYVASQRAANQNKVAGQDSNDTKSVAAELQAKAVIGDHVGGEIPAKTLPLIPPVEATNASTTPSAKPGASGTPTATLTKPTPNLDVPPTPPRQLAQSGDANEAQIRMAKWQAFQDAVRAKTAINSTAPRSPGSSGNVNTNNNAQAKPIQAGGSGFDATAAYKQKIAELQGSGILPSGGTGLSGVGGIGSSTGGQTNNSNQSNAINQFGNQSQGDRWKLNQTTEAPRSPFELRAGFVIPGTLISGINSELPGQIMGQVSQNVYDTATGQNLLIPQGSRLVGAYSSNVQYGQARVLVAWQRIIFPDGKALDIGAMPGADNAGYAGFNDQVNNHYFRIFGSALLMTGITAGVALSQPSTTTTTNGTTTYSSALSQSLGQQLGQVTSELVRKNLNISPTLEIRPGYRFNIVATKDLTFSKPYVPFDY